MKKLVYLFFFVFIFSFNSISIAHHVAPTKTKHHKSIKATHNNKTVTWQRFRVLGWKRFDMRWHYLDIMSACPYSMTVERMRKKMKAIYAVNGGFFIPSTKVPLGNITRFGENWTKYTLEERRGVLWQSEFVGIGWIPPDRTLCSIEAGPTLIYKGEIVRSLQDFLRSFWNRSNCVRNIIAIKGNYVYFYRFRGSLWGIAKYLKKLGFEYAINLDGGSSSAPGAKVPNAIMVFPKTNTIYQEYQSSDWLQKL